MAADMSLGAWRPSAGVAAPAALALGVTLGVGSRLADSLPEPLALPLNMASPWLAAAFVAGAFVRTARRGAASGVLALVAAVAAYYAYMRLAEGQANTSYLRNVAAPWLGIALVAGPLFGLAGSAWRSRSGRARSAAVALLSGAVAGEAALMLLTRPYEAAARAVLALLIAIAAALPPLLLRRRREILPAYALVPVFGLAAGAALFALLVAFRMAAALGIR